MGRNRCSLRGEIRFCGCCAFGDACVIACIRPECGISDNLQGRRHHNNAAVELRQKRLRTPVHRGCLWCPLGTCTMLPHAPRENAAIQVTHNGQHSERLSDKRPGGYRLQRPPAMQATGASTGACACHQCSPAPSSAALRVQINAQAVANARVLSCDGRGVGTRSAHVGGVGGGRGGVNLGREGAAVSPVLPHASPGSLGRQIRLVSTH